MELPDHDCPLREVVEEQARIIVEQRSVIEEFNDKLEAVLQKVQVLQRQVYGRKSEKMPSVAEEIRREEKSADVGTRRLEALRRRRERQALREKLQRQTVTHHVTDDQRQCIVCGGAATMPVGDGRKTTIFEYVPGYFVRQEHVQEKLACRCGQYIATADPPPKVIDKGRYGPGFIAHLIVMKCADSIPLHRLAKQYQRLGISMSRSTLTDLFHAGAEKLEPLSMRLLELVARSDIVQADETPMKMQRRHKRGYVWTFVADNMIAYRFAGDRSSETPVAVLGGTAGTLVVDAYTGYNRVTEVDGRERAGCLAHVRRKFFDAAESAPVETERILGLILDVYRVEHEAKSRNIVRTPAHRELRQSKGRIAMDALHTCLIEEQPKHVPKSPLGAAISYALNQWDRLIVFLDNERIPPDNNASERALRVVALGRKNFLFVGDENAGANLTGLYSLVSTCEANDIDPVAYLKDVLLRVDTQPMSRIDELLPQNWQPPICWTAAESLV